MSDSIDSRADSARSDCVRRRCRGVGVSQSLGALTFAELGASRPQAGGLYVHLRDAFGPLAALVATAIKVTVLFATGLPIPHRWSGRSERSGLQ